MSKKKLSDIKKKIDREIVVIQKDEPEEDPRDAKIREQEEIIKAYQEAQDMKRQAELESEKLESLAKALTAVEKLKQAREELLQRKIDKARAIAKKEKLLSKKDIPPELIRAPIPVAETKKIEAPQPSPAESKKPEPSPPGPAPAKEKRFVEYVYPGISSVPKKDLPDSIKHRAHKILSSK